ncbi:MULTISPECIES: Crp/Fnr family transcriptional regulator [Niastella]|uniref:Crp/Fnr family transcriptional regulator n=1 Tax=Niastella soli TaxID=2821487 RepID=A0ABS3YY37_9BACT|nr:Crp/Fnr family transcriptional regulator [Niastella soli]MBO9202734.1 Crp/Fnr family transcriptional regulator [Niastella soli]
MVAILQKYIDQFIDLPAEELEALINSIEVRQVDKKVRLTDINENEKYLYFVIKGLTRKFFLKGKEEIITQIAKEGELISSSVSYFSGMPSTYVIETIEPTTFYSLHRDRAEQLYSRYPKLERLSRLIITELFLQKEVWELERIRYSTKERFLRFMNDNPELFQRVPQKYLASYLNIKPETFSRLKHLLRSKKSDAPYLK